MNSDKFLRATDFHLPAIYLLYTFVSVGCGRILSSILWAAVNLAFAFTQAFNFRWQNASFGHIKKGYNKMAIFGKGKGRDSDDDFLHSIEQKSSASAREVDLDSRPTETNNAGLSYKSVTNNPMNYGIQDAIELIRQLPNVDSEIIIAVVRKTLESTKIQVTEIIADAQKREQAIDSRTTALTSKIDNLQNQIAELNKEIKQLNSDLKETSRVKGLLMGSIEHEQKASAKIDPGMRKPIPAKEADTRTSGQSINTAENSADKQPIT